MKKCPDEDTCCFSLREYMAIDFWGRKSACIMSHSASLSTHILLHKVTKRVIKDDFRQKFKILRNYFTRAGLEISAHCIIPEESCQLILLACYLGIEMVSATGSSCSGVVT